MQERKIERDGRPAYYRWRRLVNAAVWLTPTIRVQTFLLETVLGVPVIMTHRVYKLPTYKHDHTTESSVTKVSLRTTCMEQAADRELKLLRSTDSFCRKLKTFLLETVFGHEETC